MSQSQRGNTKRTTIKDVALVAGVSVTTVSNALNGRTDAMTRETLLRIQEAIHTLNYRPSRVARSLVTQQTGTIGVIIAEIETPLFLQALNDIESIAREADHNILLATTLSTLEDEVEVVDLLLEKQVDGMIFLSTSVVLEQNVVAELPASAPPVVLINRNAPFTGRFDQINFDNFNGVIKAVNYLVAAGHRRIAHLVGPVNRSSSVERLAGYRAGLEQHQLPYCEEYVRSADFDLPQEQWAESTLALLAVEPRPTAIIAANDRVAAIVQRTVQNAGLHVPRDISIIGIDNQPFCNYLNPALTTIQLPIIEAGKQAIEMLLARIAGQRSLREQVILPCPLMVRESTATVAEVLL